MRNKEGLRDPPPVGLECSLRLQSFCSRPPRIFTSARLRKILIFVKMSSIPSSIGSAANSSSTAVLPVRLVLEPNTVSAPQPANEYVDEAFVASVDGWLKHFDFVFKKRSLRRKMITLGIPISYSTGTSLKKTGFTSSSVHAGELSVEGRDALIHISRIIEEYDGEY